MPRKHRLRSEITVTEVAEVMGVCAATVVNWLNLGHLDGYRLPGPAGARRISKASFFRFLARNGLSEKLKELGGVIAILVVGDSVVADSLRNEFESEGVKVFFAADSFSMGLIYATEKPTAVIVDTAFETETAVLLHHLQKTREQCCRIALVDSDTLLGDLEVDKVFHKPFRYLNLVETLKGLFSAKETHTGRTLNGHAARACSDQPQQNSSRS